MGYSKKLQEGYSHNCACLCLGRGLCQDTWARARRAMADAKRPKVTLIAPRSTSKGLEGVPETTKDCFGVKSAAFSAGLTSLPEAKSDASRAEPKAAGDSTWKKSQTRALALPDIGSADDKDASSGSANIQHVPLLRRRSSATGACVASTA